MNKEPDQGLNQKKKFIYCDNFDERSFCQWILDFSRRA